MSVIEHGTHITETSCRALYRSTSEPFDVDQAVRDLIALREVREALAQWEGVLTELLEAALGYNTTEVDGRQVSVKRGANRKSWDHDGLARVVLARARDERAIDPETGEAEDLAEAALRVLRDCAHIDYWRKQALAGRGVDVDEYCATSPGRVTVVVE